MHKSRWLWIGWAACLWAGAAGNVPLLREGWDYGKAMRKGAARFTGKAGVVIHIGDSITYANPYSQWARGGKGKTSGDEAICRWMRTGADDDTDGWHLCSVDLPEGRSATAVGGIRIDEYLAGGKAGIPPLAEVVKKYNPQIAVLMLGTNDITAGRPLAAYKADMAKAVDILLANGTIPILSTLPPYPGKEETAVAFNAALKEIGRAKRIPMIDYWGEIIKRRPADWNGTLLSRDDVHPTASQGGTAPDSEPTEENLRNSGYLLRGWLSVQKIAEVKSRVIREDL
ncbi:MAG: SGNH/GDSL hydrolase family protein [Armatimonadetes bacterium]|nr:SGNH/GDSL hydrolase family protein [Armatimonadota bacterium]